MSVTITTVTEKRRVDVTFGPDATPEERYRAMLDLAEVLALHPGFGALVDVRAPARILEYDDARRIIDAVVARASVFRGGIALLAVEGVTYGVARVQQAIGEAYGVELGVFTDREEALAWLALRAPA